MKNLKSLMAILFTLILVFVGCKNSINEYKKAVINISLPSKLKEVDTTCDDIITQTDILILKDDINQTSLDDLSKKIKDWEDNTINLKNQINNISHSNTDLTDIHTMLVFALDTYLKIGDKAQNILSLEKSLNDDYKNIGIINQDLMNIAFSGSPTSLEYNQELNDFMNRNIDSLKLFDLETAKELLGAKEINTEYIKSFLEKSKDLFNEFQSIQTYNETDKKVSSLLVQMYEQIADMYNIVINNKELIEWSNNYSSFSEGVSTEKQQCVTNIDNWAKKIELQLK